MHMAQLMPLPLTVSCFSKIQIGFTFLVPAHLGSPQGSFPVRKRTGTLRIWRAREREPIWGSGGRCPQQGRKLNKLRGSFFIFPDNFTHSILIAKKYPTWGSRFGGYSAPKSVSEAKISKLTLFRAAPATKRLDPEVQWWFYFVRQRVL